MPAKIANRMRTKSILLGGGKEVVVYYSGESEGYGGGGKNISKASVKHQ